MAQKTIGDVRTPGQIREAVIRSLDAAYDSALRDGDFEEIERLAQSPIEDVVGHAASRPATAGNLESLFGTAA